MDKKVRRRSSQRSNSVCVRCAQWRVMRASLAMQSMQKCVHMCGTRSSLGYREESYSCFHITLFTQQLCHVPHACPLSQQTSNTCTWSVIWSEGCFLNRGQISFGGQIVFSGIYSRLKNARARLNLEVNFGGQFCFGAQFWKLGWIFIYRKLTPNSAAKLLLNLSSIFVTLSLWSSICTLYDNLLQLMICNICCGVDSEVILGCANISLTCKPLLLMLVGCDTTSS